MEIRGNGVKPEYLEYIRLRDEGRIPKPITWEKWQKMTQDEKKALGAA